MVNAFSFGNKNSLQRKNVVETLRFIEKCISLVFGPKKKSVLFAKSKQKITYLPNGSSFFKSFEFENDRFSRTSQNYHPLFFRIFEQAATKTYTISGDGSTLTLLFASTLLKDAFQLVLSGYNLLFLQNGLKKLNHFFLTKILDEAQPVRTEENLKGVLQTAFGCKLNPEILPFLQTMTASMSRDTVFSIEENLAPTNEIETVQGIEIEKGFLSSYFVNDTNRFEVRYDNPFILITTIPLHAIEQIADILKEIQQKKRPLVIFTQEISKDVLSSLIVNTIQKKLNVVVIKYTSIEFLKDGLMEDLALLTHTHFVQKEVSSSNWKFTNQDLGVAKKIIVTKNKTTCFVSKFGQVLLTRHLNELARSLTLNDSEYERSLLQTRINRLSGQFIKLKFTPVYQMEQQNQVIENLIQTLKSSLEEGILPGGGCFHKALQTELMTWSNMNLLGEEFVAAYLVANVLAKPSFLLFSKKSIFSLFQRLNYPYSYDLNQNKIVHCFDEGLVDAAKSIRGSFWNAITLVTLLLTTFEPF
jgi:chaperonin GroEL